MPLDPPVMTATLFSSFPMTSPVCVGASCGACARRVVFLKPRHRLCVNAPLGNSAARTGVAGDERCVGGKPAGHELREKPHALGLARFAVCEKPERAVLVQDGA